jgi:hypothetical protein
MIKNAMIIGLCSILTLEALFPDVNLADLSNLSELADHFNEHRITSPEIGFAEFLALHYCDSNHLASTPADHQKLPFSKRQLHRVFLQIFQEPVVINPHSGCAVVKKTEDVYRDTFLAREISSQVWQPPRG